MTLAHRPAAAQEYASPLAALLALFSCAAIGQTPVPPTAGDISRDIQRTDQFVPTRPGPVSPAIVLPAAQPGDARAEITRFEFEQVTLVTPEELRSVMAPFVGQSLTLRQMEAALQRVVGFYRQRGWVASVYLPPQEIAGGVVRVAVLEGKLAEVSVKGEGDPANVAFVGRVVTARVQQGQPLPVAALERGLLIANDLPGVSATGVLEPAASAGGLRLNVNVQPLASFKAHGEVRNHGGRSTGEEQLVAGFEHAPNRGYGERLSVNALASQGTRAANVNFSGAMNNDGLRLGVAASHLNYRLIGEFAPLGVRGHTDAVSLNASYPWLRSEAANVRLTASATLRHNRDYALDTLLRDRRLNLQTIAIEGDRRDDWGGGGVTFGMTGLTVGSVHLRGLASDIAQDTAGPLVAGSFSKLTLAAGRSQSLTSQFWLTAFVAAQWADSNLDPSERFVLGGPGYVRGYPVGEAAGDGGYLVKLELHRELAPGWQGFAFIDSGRIRVNARPWPGAASPNSYSLHAAGAGVAWKDDKGWSLEASIAAPVGRHRGANRSGFNQDGSKRGPRLWVKLVREL